MTILPYYPVPIPVERPSRRPAVRGWVVLVFTIAGFFTLGLTWVALLAAFPIGTVLAGRAYQRELAAWQEYEDYRLNIVSRNDAIEKMNLAHALSAR